MATPKLEIAIVAVNEAGRKKSLVWEGEYGTDKEVFDAFAAIQTAASSAHLTVVSEHHGWGVGGPDVHPTKP